MTRTIFTFTYDKDNADFIIRPDIPYETNLNEVSIRVKEFNMTVKEEIITKFKKHRDNVDEIGKEFLDNLRVSNIEIQHIS